MTSRRASIPVVACELSDSERHSRTLEWADLTSLALSRKRIANGASQTYPIELADDLDQLVSLENTCCGSWLEASTTRIGNVIRLEVTTATPAGLAVLEAMAGFGTGSSDTNE